MATFHIERTWNGEPATAKEHCTVGLVSTEGGWRVEVRAAFHGDRPPPGASGSYDGLWSFEVVELFIAEASGSDESIRYTEIELGPQGHHLILRFEGLRRRLELLEPLSWNCRIRGSRWQGRVELPREALPPPPWRANAFAMHGRGGSRRYLAAAPLPGERPDFHQPRAFPLVAD